MDDSSLSKTWAAAGMGGRTGEFQCSFQGSSLPTLQLTGINTNPTHPSRNKEKTNQLTFSFPKMHSIQRAVEFPHSPKFLAAALNFFSCVLYYDNSYWNHCHGFTEMPSDMILFFHFRMLKTVLQGTGINPTNPWVKLQQDSARVVRWTGGQGRGWEAQEWHRKMEILCCWASSRPWEIPQFKIASILHMGRRNTAVYEEIKKQFWWEAGASPGSEHFPQEFCEPWWSKSSTLVTLLEQNWCNHMRGKKNEMQRQMKNSFSNDRRGLGCSEGCWGHLTPLSLQPGVTARHQQHPCTHIDITE